MDLKGRHRLYRRQTDRRVERNARFTRSRGQFYSLTAVVIAIPVLLFVAFSLTSISESRYSVQEKLVADQLHLIEKSIEEDFSKAVEISSKRAVITMTDQVITNGSFLNKNESSDIFTELMWNGTLFGKPKFLMTNNTLFDWKAKILNITTGFEIDFNFTNPIGVFNATLFTGDYGLNITVKDRFSSAKIEKRNEREQFQVDFTGLEDPTFILNTDGLARRSFHMYPYEIFAQEFHALEVHFNNETGNVTFERTVPGDPDLILVVNEHHPLLTGWKCVLAQSGIPPPSQSCYATGMVDPVFNIGTAINNSGNYSTLFLDNLTGSAWLLPVITGIEKGQYYDYPGPNVFDRLTATYNSSLPQFATFLHADEMQKIGIVVDQTQSHVAWSYFLGADIPGYSVRGFPTWFRAGNGSSTVLGFDKLVNFP